MTSKVDKSSIKTAQQMRELTDRMTLLNATYSEELPLLGAESKRIQQLRKQIGDVHLEWTVAPFVRCPHFRKMVCQGYSGDHCTPSCGQCRGTDWIPL